MQQSQQNTLQDISHRTHEFLKLDAIRDRENLERIERDISETKNLWSTTSGNNLSIAADRIAAFAHSALDCLNKSNSMAEELRLRINYRECLDNLLLRITEDKGGSIGITKEQFSQYTKSVSLASTERDRVTILENLFETLTESTRNQLLNNNGRVSSNKRIDFNVARQSFDSYQNRNYYPSVIQRQSSLETSKTTMKIADNSLGYRTLEEAQHMRMLGNHNTAKGLLFGLIGDEVRQVLQDMPEKARNILKRNVDKDLKNSGEISLLKDRLNSQVTEQQIVEQVKKSGVIISKQEVSSLLATQANASLGKLYEFAYDRALEQEVIKRLSTTNLPFIKSSAVKELQKHYLNNQPFHWSVEERESFASMMLEGALIAISGGVSGVAGRTAASSIRAGGASKFGTWITELGVNAAVYELSQSILETPLGGQEAWKDLPKRFATSLSMFATLQGGQLLWNKTGSRLLTKAYGVESVKLVDGVRIERIAKEGQLLNTIGKFATEVSVFANYGLGLQELGALVDGRQLGEDALRRLEQLHEDSLKQLVSLKIGNYAIRPLLVKCLYKMEQSGSALLQRTNKIAHDNIANPISNSRAQDVKEGQQIQILPTYPDKKNQLLRTILPELSTKDITHITTSPSTQIVDELQRRGRNLNERQIEILEQLLRRSKETPNVKIVIDKILAGEIILDTPQQQQQQQQQQRRLQQRRQQDDQSLNTRKKAARIVKQFFEDCYMDDCLVGIPPRGRPIDVQKKWFGDLLKQVPNMISSPNPLSEYERWLNIPIRNDVREKYKSARLDSGTFKILDGLLDSLKRTSSRDEQAAIISETALNINRILRKTGTTLPDNKGAPLFVPDEMLSGNNLNLRITTEKASELAITPLEAALLDSKVIGTGQDGIVLQIQNERVQDFAAALNIRVLRSPVVGKILKIGSLSTIANEFSTQEQARKSMKDTSANIPVAYGYGEIQIKNEQLKQRLRSLGILRDIDKLPLLIMDEVQGVSFAQALYLTVLERHNSRLETISNREELIRKAERTGQYDLVRKLEFAHIPHDKDIKKISAEVASLLNFEPTDGISDLNKLAEIHTRNANKLYSKMKELKMITNKSFLHQIKSGIEDMHRANVCHGDLHEANVMVSHTEGNLSDLFNPNGNSFRAWIIDFGRSSSDDLSNANADFYVVDKYGNLK